MTWVRVLRAVSATGATLLLAACAPDLNWRDVRAEGTPVVLSLPCKPVEQRRTALLAGRSVALQLRVCDAGGVTWAWLWADVADPAAVGPALTALVTGAHANVGAPVLPLEAFTVPGATPRPEGGQARLVGQLPDGRTVAEHLLVFAVGTQVHQVTALAAGDGQRGPMKDPWAAAAEMCLASVRVQP